MSNLSEYAKRKQLKEAGYEMKCTVEGYSVFKNGVYITGNTLPPFARGLGTTQRMALADAWRDHTTIVESI